MQGYLARLADAERSPRPVAESGPAPSRRGGDIGGSAEKRRARYRGARCRYALK